MPAGKSSERLAEELGAYMPELAPLFGLSPIEVYKTSSSQVLEPDFSGYCFSSLPYWPKIFNGFFVSSRTHLQVESDRNLRADVNGDVERDWQVVDRSPDGNIIVLMCSMTGAQLTINIFSSEIPQNVRATFSSAALNWREQRQRQASEPPSSAQSPTPSQTTNQSSNQTYQASSTTTESWQLFARIVHDLIITSPHDRRNISSTTPKPARLLELDVILPFLGFQFDPDTHLYKPPLDASPQYLHWLRRVLLETRFETMGFNARDPLIPSVSRFLGCGAVSGDAFLSPAIYGCLGSVTTFSDDRLLTRFELAIQNDGVHGGPWYLECLTRIAQQTQSEILETRVIELMSLGTPTLSSLQEEFAKLGLSLDSQEQLSDAQLLDLVMDIPAQDTKSLFSAVCSVRPSQVWQRASAAPTMSDDDALRVFSTDIIDETIIADRFNLVWTNGTTIDKLESRYALLKLALSTRSSKLLALYETVAPIAREPRPTYSEALALLGLTPDVTDQDIEAIFGINSDDVSGPKLLDLRRALRVIAEERQSSELLAYLGHSDGSFVEDGLIDLTSDHEPGPRLPVGLWNIGNTCYLNSLLQFYYSLPRLREYVLAYHDPNSKSFASDSNRGENNADNDVESGLGRFDEVMEIDHAEQANPQNDANNNVNKEEEQNGDIEISDIEEEESNKTNKEESVPPVKEGSVEEISNEQDDKKELVKADSAQNDQPKEEKSKKIGGRIVPPKEIRRSQIFVDRFGQLFRQINETPASHVTPSEILAYMALVPPQEDADEVIAASGPGEESVLRGRLIGALQRQQDVTECSENVLDQLEATMSATHIDPEDGEQYDLIKELFYGTTVQTLARVKDGGNRRTKMERYSSLLLDVSDGPTSIYDSMDNYFGDDILDLEDGTTLRTLRLKSVPEILQVQVQRVQFDKTTFLPYKNLNQLIFPDTVYLDRYLDTPQGSELDLRTQKVKQWRKELEEIESELGSNSDIVARRDSLATTLNWLTDGDTEANTSRRVSESTLSEVRKHHAGLSGQLSDLESKRKEMKHAIDHEFDDLRQYGYRIHSLFIHKGDVSYGHYWIYIRDMETGEFYKYNDEIVSRVSADEVFDFTENNLATPYFLVFTRV